MPSTEFSRYEVRYFPAREEIGVALSTYFPWRVGKIGWRILTSLERYRASRSSFSLNFEHLWLSARETDRFVACKAYRSRHENRAKATRLFLVENSLAERVSARLAFSRMKNEASLKLAS